MKTKRSKSKKEKTVVLSAAELTKFGMGVLTKAVNVVNSAKKSKLTITLEQD